MNMYNLKTLLAAASMAVAMAAGASPASAAPWDRHMDRPTVRHTTMHRPVVMQNRVVQVLRNHHYRVAASPVFFRGHYVVKSFNRRGRIVLVEINPYTGAFLGEFRI
jgi:Ni/Co efflux regulator RcnB